MQTKNLAIMFTDIKGYTERTSQQTHDKTSTLLKEHQGLVVPVIHAFHGTVIKTIGDAFLVAFDSPTASVQCGMTIQDTLHKYNHGRPEAEQIHLRVAINVGEVLQSRGDVFGEAVNIASRIEGITPAKEVYLAESVYLTMNRSEVSAEKVGDFTLKGIPEPVTVYRVPPAVGTERAAAVAQTGRRMTAPDLLTLPFGGKYLTRVESMVLTPALKRKLLIGGLGVLLVGLLALTIPSYVRERQWMAIEAAIGRGTLPEALGSLHEIGPSDDDERKRQFGLQVQIATRLLERGDAEPLADLLLAMTPLGPQEGETHAKLLAQDLDQLITNQSLDYATRLLNRVTPHTESEKRWQFDKRVRLAEALLERGRLDELKAQVEILLGSDLRDARAHLLDGHLHFALAQQGEAEGHSNQGMEAYERALGIELAIGGDQRMATNVAAAYANGLSGRAQAKLIARADALVEKFLRDRVTPALLRQLNMPGTPKVARDALEARITKLGAEKDVDRVRFIIQDLESIVCKSERDRKPTGEVIDRLRAEGGNDLRALGALLRFAQLHNPCQPEALEAIQRLVGERIGFMTASETTLFNLIGELGRADCKSPSARAQVESLLRQTTRLNDPRVLGAVLTLAARDGACLDLSQRAAEAIVGQRVVFQPDKEARLLQLLGDLANARCDSSGASRLIASLAGEKDPRAIGPILRLADQGGGCVNAALEAARKLGGLPDLSLTCASPALETLKVTPCSGKSAIAKLDAAMNSLAKERNLAAVGPMLRLASQGGDCAEVALTYARRTLGADGLALTCAAPAPTSAPPPAPPPDAGKKPKKKSKR